MTAQPPVGTSPLTVRHVLATAGAGLLVVVAVMVFLSLSLLLPPVAKELGVGMGAVSPDLAPLMQGNGLTLTEAGSLISVLSIGTIVTTLALGAVLDKWGALAGTLLALAAFAAALLVFLTTRGYTGQLVAIVLFAVASVLAPIAAPVIVRQLFGGRAFASLVGIALAGMPLGVAVGSPLWGIAYDVAGNYRPALIGGLVLLGVVAGLFSYALLGNRSRASH